MFKIKKEGRRFFVLKREENKKINTEETKTKGKISNLILILLIILLTATYAASQTVTTIKSPKTNLAKTEETEQYQTKQVIYHIASNNYWDTMLETMNATPVDNDYTIQAFDTQGNTLGTRTITIARFGLLNTTVKELFPEIYSQINTIQISCDKYLVGKLYTAQRFAFLNGGEQASTMISLPEAKAKLSVPHIAEEQQWWTGIAITNIGTERVNVFFKNSNGEYFLVLENMSPGEEGAFLFKDIAGELKTGAGDIIAYTTDASLTSIGGISGGQMVNALAGEIVYGMREGYGFSEAYQLRGSVVHDGEVIADNFGTEHYIPLDQVRNMLHLNRDTKEWDGIAYRNVTDKDQEVHVRHFVRDGSIREIQGLEELVLDVPAGQRVAFVPEQFGIDSDAGGVLVVQAFDSDGNPVKGDAIYLNGDLEDDVGRSVLGGGDVPTNLARSRYLNVPLTVDSENSAVVTVFNPTDENVRFSFVATYEDGSGPGVSSAYRGITLAPHGSYTVDLGQDMFANTGDFKGVIGVVAESGSLVGVVNRYTKSDDKATANVDGMVMAPCNDPYGEYVSQNFRLNGTIIEGDTLEVLVNTPNSIIVGYDTKSGTNELREAKLFLDGKEVNYEIISMFSGQTALDYTFTNPGEHKLEIVLYADDGNVIPDTSLEKIVKVHNKVDIYTLKFYNYKGEEIPYGPDINPADYNLEQNDTLKVVYDVGWYGRDGITKLRFAPGGFGEEYYFDVLLDENGHASGEAYIKLGDLDRTYEKRWQPGDDTGFYGAVTSGILWQNVPEEKNLIIADAYSILQNEEARKELADILGREDVTYGEHESLTDFQTEYDYLSTLVDGDATNNDEMIQENGVVIGKLDDKLFLEVYNDLGVSSRRWYNMKTEIVDTEITDFFKKYHAQIIENN